MWKTVERNPHYEVNEFGQIRSVRKNIILTPKKNHDGYLRIQLWDHRKCHFVSIHILVGEAFLEKPPGQNVVINHKSGIKDDNRVENLEWVSQQENIAHAWRTGLSRSHLNSNGKKCRQFTKDGDFVREFLSTMEVERVLGICHTDISASAKRKGTAGGYRWEVVNE